MPNEERQKNFTALLTTPEWVEVSEVVKEQVCELLDIRRIDPTQDDQAIAKEVRARILAVDKLLDFYNRYQFTQSKTKDVEYNFK